MESGICWTKKAWAILSSHSQAVIPATVLIGDVVMVILGAWVGDVVIVVPSAWVRDGTEGVEDCAKELNMGQGMLPLKCSYRPFLLIVV